MLSFDPKLISELIAAVKKRKPAALCGPPGSGKLTLLKQIAPHACVRYLEHQVDEVSLKYIMSRYLGNEQLGMEKPQYSVWALVPAELLNMDWSTINVAFPLILISTEKVHGVSTIYMPRPRIQDMVNLVVKNFKLSCGAAWKLAESVGCDVRQLQLRAQFGALFSTDRSAHLHFDTSDILKGQARPPQHYNTAWLARNAGGNLDNQATFFEYMATADTFSWGRQCSSVISCATAPSL